MITRTLRWTTAARNDSPVSAKGYGREGCRRIGLAICGVNLDFGGWTLQWVCAPLGHDPGILDTGRSPAQSQPVRMSSWGKSGIPAG